MLEHLEKTHGLEPIELLVQYGPKSKGFMPTNAEMTRDYILQCLPCKLIPKIYKISLLVLNSLSMSADIEFLIRTFWDKSHSCLQMPMLPLTDHVSLS